jgi:glutamate/tyrosine decarboxylase-like PLP-dependent enzyme
MNMNILQNKMFNELKDKNLFNQTQQYGYNYLDNALDRNVFPTEEALQNLVHFDEALPSESANAIDVLNMLQNYGAPATNTSIGGRYFGFVTGSAVPIGIATKQLATIWDQNSALNVISPVASKLESTVEKWLRELFDFEDDTVAGFVSGTSMANFCGLAAGRFRLLERIGWNVNKKGLFNAPSIRVVAGRHAHSTILKTISLLGFGTENIEWVDVDDQGRMRADLVPELDDKTLVILQAGNVNSGAFDPFDDICNKANKANAWVHIDGAFGLWAAATERFNYLTKGIEKANSYAVDAHKTLNTPYDSGIILCNDSEALISALHMEAGYIVQSKEKDGMYFTPEMSRRARIFELWATLKYLGRQGINEMINGFHDRSIQFANAIKEVEGFELINEVDFNQIIVKCNSDELTEKVIAKIQELRDCWVGGSTWNDSKVIRISICAWTTTKEDIDRSVESFKHAYQLVN